MHTCQNYHVDGYDEFNEENSVNADMNAIEKDQAYAIDDVLFATGRADLNAQSKMILDELIITMQENPTLIIEMGSHTDDVGGDAMNLTLSQKRADACVDYTSLVNSCRSPHCFECMAKPFQSLIIPPKKAVLKTEEQSLKWLEGYNRSSYSRLSFISFILPHDCFKKS